MIRYLLTLIVAVALVSCSSRAKRLELEKAERIASKIQVSMTFKQIASVIDLTQYNQDPVVEHGNISYDVQISKYYWLFLTFEPPRSGQTYLEARMVLPPLIIPMTKDTILPSRSTRNFVDGP